MREFHAVNGLDQPTSKSIEKADQWLVEGARNQT